MTSLANLYTISVIIVPGRYPTLISEIVGYTLQQVANTDGCDCYLYVVCGGKPLLNLHTSTSRTAVKESLPLLKVNTLTC